MISNGDKIHEKYDGELTFEEISESFLSKYLPNSQSARFLFNSKILKPEQKLSEIGYSDGKIIFVYPKPALKPKEPTQPSNPPKQEEKQKNENMPKTSNDSQKQNAETKSTTPSTPQHSQNLQQETIKEPKTQQQQQIPQTQNPHIIHQPQSNALSNHAPVNHNSANPQRNQMKNAHKLKPDPKFIKLRELILEDPPNSFNAVIDSISADDPVLGDRIKRNPRQFLALMGISYKDEDGKITLKKF